MHVSNYSNGLQCTNLITKSSKIIEKHEFYFCNFYSNFFLTEETANQTHRTHQTHRTSFPLFQIKLIKKVYLNSHIKYCKSLIWFRDDLGSYVKPCDVPFSDQKPIRAPCGRFLAF